MDQVGRVQIDKTSSIEELINSINGTISYKSNHCSKLMIPSKYDYEIGFLLNGLIGITRKDLQNLDKIRPKTNAKKGIQSSTKFCNGTNLFINSTKDSRGDRVALD